MAAAQAASLGRKVALLERNQVPGKKLAITGKGRCNLTNNCTPADCIANMTKNARFLYSAFHQFSPADTMAFFEGLGVPLKTERGERVFPVSDKASDIVQAMEKHCVDLGVTFVKGRAKKLILKDGAIRGVEIDDGRKLFGEAVLIATGGLSYPKTGSSGDGYTLAKQAGHTVLPQIPSLVPVEEAGDTCREMQGLSLKNVKISVYGEEKNPIYSDFGELLFTHFGLSGPTILSASAHMRKAEEYRVVIDFKPALDEKTLDKRILRDMEKYARKDLINALDELLPQKSIPVIIARAGIDPRCKASELSRWERAALLGQIKAFTVPVSGLRPVEEAVVTSGGVDVSAVEPKTMRSKLVDGLFFAGEVLDVDAYTGGFNLQIAFSTGYLAGQNL